MLQKIEAERASWLGFSRLLSPPKQSEYGETDRLGHFYGVDFLRGLASVAVLIWHYQHFFMGTPVAHGAPTPGMMVARSEQPFYGLLWPVYEHGFWAVQAFWIISGFVFAHVYAGRKTSGNDFALARFARLYPLHFVTLLFVAAAQFVSYKLLGGYQITGFNDLYHFFLNVFFVSGWTFHLGHSFNDPIWSVSVELAIYGVFFFLARRLFAFGVLVPLLFVGLGGAIMNQGTPLWNFGMCLFFFFEGVLAFYVLTKFRQNTVLLISGCALSLAYFAYLVATGKAATKPFHNVESYLFVPIILMVAMLDLSQRIQPFLKSIRWLGDATYSMYLWHFPMQVVILLLVERLGIAVNVFKNPITLICWIVGMTGFSALSFRYLEKPLQKWSRTTIRQALQQPDRDDKVQAG